MELASINIVVKDADAALQTYLKLFGTNNVDEIIKLKGLRDDSETVDGYWLKTRPLNLAIFTPRGSAGRMGEFLQKYGEGIHHIQLHMGQDEFERTYAQFKSDGWPVSHPTYYGKFSEAVFWLEESGEQGVPVKFATKTYRALKMWKDTVYFDTPQKFEVMNTVQQIIRPRLDLKTPVVSVKYFEKQQQVWASMLSRPVHLRHAGEGVPVDDKRGNQFIANMFNFPNRSKISVYHALNEEGSIRRTLARRGKDVMYYDMILHFQRDKTHEIWRQWEEAGFDMVDPKPLLNQHGGNGNYFFFIHPISTHGVVCEFVSLWNFPEDESSDVHMIFDWSDTKTFIVPPDINN
jgi:catechol 2,3-dioxygenase-like lactoylglutathione lyase family enzyme